MGEGEDMETGRGSNQARHVMLDGVGMGGGGVWGEMKQRAETPKYPHPAVMGQMRDQLVHHFHLEPHIWRTIEWFMDSCSKLLNASAGLGQHF